MYFSGALGLIARAAFDEGNWLSCNSLNAYLLGSAGCWLVPIAAAAAQNCWRLQGLPCTTRSWQSVRCTELCFELRASVCSSMVTLFSLLRDFGSKGRKAPTSERTCCCQATGFQSLSGPREWWFCSQSAQVWKVMLGRSWIGHSGWRFIATCWSSLPSFQGYESVFVEFGMCFLQSSNTLACFVFKADA